MAFVCTHRFVYVARENITGSAHHPGTGPALLALSPPPPCLGAKRPFVSQRPSVCWLAMMASEPKWQGQRSWGAASRERARSRCSLRVRTGFNLWRAAENRAAVPRCSKAVKDFWRFHKILLCFPEESVSLCSRRFYLVPTSEQVFYIVRLFVCVCVFNHSYGLIHTQQQLCAL